ncbi:MAG: helix-turn-helix domain-containing protein [Lachnospiraceae bacterium]|nr:helix-turn-helix domain-containing protein [Lachnospiraceae bacterium]
MISSQVIKTSIDELKAISKVDLCVFDLEGKIVATTFEPDDISHDLIAGFTNSPADSQIIGNHHLMKVLDESELLFILDAKGTSEDAYMISKIAVSQLQNLIIAYKEKYDRNNFFQNLLLDNLLLVDIYNRAKRLHIEVSVPRAILLIEMEKGKSSSAAELLKGMFSSHSGDYITAVDEDNVILVKAMDNVDDYALLEQVAHTIVDMINMEAMMNVRVAYGTIVSELRDVSKSYKEAKMALDVGKIFYAEKKVTPYNKLGIGRLIYQLPNNLCRIFMDEIFGENIPDELDEEILTTINKFFENNLNVSETSRQLFVHRNTLVYRLEKLEKTTGLDIRTFDDALTFKIALMVANYMKYMDSIK